MSTSRQQPHINRGFQSPYFLRQLILFISLSLLVCSLFADISFDESFLAKIEQEYGDYARKRLQGWQKLIEDNQGKSEQEVLEAVNRYFNLQQFISDIAHWGQSDYWATPLEFLVSGGGDCEDFSIAKYFTLRELGVADEKLLITYVKAIDINQAHMVLTYYETPESEPAVLDNLVSDILPASKRGDLVPVYSFNGAGLWQAKQRGLGNKIGKPGEMKRWSDLQERMEKGKINKFRGG